MADGADDVDVLSGMSTVGPKVAPNGSMPMTRHLNRYSLSETIRQFAEDRRRKAGAREFSEAR